MDVVDGLKKMSLENAPILRPSSDFRIREKGCGTLFLMEVEPGRKAYRYDVNISQIILNRDGQSYEKNFAKGSDEGLRSRNRNLCYEILSIAFVKTNAFGLPDGGDIIYDCKSTLYCSTPISLSDRNIEISSDDTNSYIKTYCGEKACFLVTIIANSSGHVLNLSDFSQYTTKQSMIQEDRSVRTFLEMAIAQFSLNSNVYTPIGAGKLFETETTNNVERIGNGMILRAGVAKGVRICQNYGKPCPALILDSKVCPFFAHQKLYNTITDMCRGEPRSDHEWDRVRNLLQDVRVELVNARNRTFGIRAISRESADQLTIQYNGETITIADYYRIVYNYELKFPHLRTVIPNFVVAVGEQPEYFPIEICIVMPDQRVPLEKMDKVLSAKLLNRNSVLPEVRMNTILSHARRMHLFNNNPVLSAFGIRVIEGSNEVEIGVRHNPKIAFAGNRVITPNPQEVEWKRASSGLCFYETHEISRWIVLCNKEHIVDVRKFVQCFKNGASRRGMYFLGDPLFPTFSGAKWQETFEKCATKGIEFILLVDPIVEDTHGLLKYYEARHKVITQHVTYERAMDVVNDRRKAQTLENILNKTNCKLFGMNYVPIFERSADKFSLESNKVLVLGYDVAHPPPMTTMERRMVQAVRLDLQSFDPSVVGITANMGKHPHNFVGDYFYQEARKDFLDIYQLATRIKWVLDTLEANRPEAAAPPYIFVLRNGLSEGQFTVSVGKEMEALREGCRMYRRNYFPKFVYVIGTKRHFKKFFVQHNRIENLTPGSVISTKFVREDCPEFFLMSHFPLKGVGKPVEYNVLVDEIGVSQDELQGVLNSLCYTHQIVNSAVSLPEPIYQADELAKRGRNNYITMKRLEEHIIPRLPEHNLVDVSALTNMLSYESHMLKSTRFTA